MSQRLRPVRRPARMPPNSRELSLEYPPLIIAFLVGLFSTVHCLGMCGGIVGALTFSLALEVRNRGGLLPWYSTAYSLGRITSYSIAGAITGALGGTLLVALGGHGQFLVQLVAATLLVGIGLYIAGWFPSLARIERVGLPLWRRLEPLGRRLLPVRGVHQAYLFGLVWGWLPCGLVYSALIFSLSAGGALEGAAFMFFFGLGTMPAMVTAGVMAGTLARFVRRPMIRRVVGVTVILMAVATITVPGQFYGTEALGAQ